jgi:hypothetical protein
VRKVLEVVELKLSTMILMALVSTYMLASAGRGNSVAIRAVVVFI